MPSKVISILLEILGLVPGTAESNPPDHFVETEIQEVLEASRAIRILDQNVAD